MFFLLFVILVISRLWFEGWILIAVVPVLCILVLFTFISPLYLSHHSGGPQPSRQPPQHHHGQQPTTETITALRRSSVYHCRHHSTLMAICLPLLNLCQTGGTKPISVPITASLGGYQTAQCSHRLSLVVLSLSV